MHSSREPTGRSSLTIPELPTLDPDVTLIEAGGDVRPLLQTLAVDELLLSSGRALWVGTGRHCTNETLVEVAPDRRVLDRETLRRIAQLADGDARRAITALRVAARKTAAEGLSTVPADIVDEAVFDAESEVRRKTISKLNQHQRVLYECIEEHGPLIQKELYEQYTDAHPDPITLRCLRKTHLPKLEHYNLITTERDRGSKSYRLSENESRLQG